MKNVRSVVLSVLMVAVFALALTGLKQEKTVAGEKDKGEITVYTALEDEQVTEYLAAFNCLSPKAGHGIAYFS